MVAWVCSDGLNYTDEEIVTEVIRALEFRRRGSRIVRAIEEAIRAWRNP
jgi:hypothetical protein